MKKLLYFFLAFILFTNANAQVTTSPTTVLAEQPVTITFNKTGTELAPYTGIIYAYIGVTVNGVRFQNIKGSPDFTSPLHPQMTQVGTSSNYTLTISPDLYTYFGVPTNSSITEICVVFRSADASLQSRPDIFIPVGAFQYNLTAPALNSNNIISSGSNVTVTANNTNGPANYQLFVNGSNTPINNQNTSNYSFVDNNVTVNKNYVLRITQGNTTFTARFSVIINPGNLTGAMPSGLVDGINYNTSDPTKATLVLNAPFKSFIYVAGSFNNWQPTSAFAMKRDTASGSTKYWLELTGLTPGQIYAYQYWVCDVVNLPAGSPSIVKTADPFSTLVLSPFDDPEIISLGVFPNLPAYSTIAPGQDREVSVLQTGPNNLFSYNWSSSTTNFVKPKKKDLVFYELLVRDFDANRTYQDLINKIDYFKNLKINAIKLMPVMEFEGNMSWGYNTVYHMALDKRYGPPAKLKEFIDLCHQNGIAVILDIALNHVFGRSPLERMWMLDSDNDGWANGTGPRTTFENPYVNVEAQHSYNVGSDLNHFRETGPGGNLTNTYAIRTIQYWINEFKIDGYRWDLTKGFTNQCPPNVSGGQEPCTNGYRSDRKSKMEWYATNQWAADPLSLVIFEHLGTGGSAQEEVEWANYNRTGNQGGIMQWRKMTDPYANLLKGNATNLAAVTDPSDRMIGYAESHDEERVVYKALNEAGQTQGNLSKVLQRLPAMGSVLFLVPGPKMMWHFGELGWDKSLWTCSNGNVSFSNPDCKLDTKPQPQWSENWLENEARANVYNQWARQIDLRINEDVFENGQFAWNFSQTGRPRLDVWTNTAQTSSLSYVFVLTNFSDNTYNAPGGFPFTGNWVNLMDNSVVNVSSQNQSVSIEPGGYRVFGNQQSTLNTNAVQQNSISIYPNPAKNSFTLNGEISKAEIYSITGQLVKSFTANSSEYQYDISDINPGVYLVKVLDNQNRSKTMKLIKQ
ncbi:alpha-amylase family glycosyl hydrolase [Flavobacterium dankookense]|uniref:Putative secreted protein (Por secretion system target) n=1 Tax=Flavobacterium dankookense TaxID=706186 RepID=A0A4R6Q803_9FLAO|nr:alpha-amylase family glycosyl hydrolase [Flavobacterium dankookense]TDP58674.1 putative secreted protein (Por secretion system target) [Flavobacterium dankookense]